MPTVKFIEQDGTEHEVDAASGLSLMEAAVNNLVPGIEAECGGACSCATCHVYVDAKWLDVVGHPQQFELDTLEGAAAEVQENSRLSCQIDVSDEMDGLVVQLPEFQY